MPVRTKNAIKTGNANHFLRIWWIIPSSLSLVGLKGKGQGGAACEGLWEAASSLLQISPPHPDPKQPAMRTMQNKMEIATV
jgi:hypothetical protein